MGQVTTGRFLPGIKGSAASLGLWDQLRSCLPRLKLFTQYVITCPAATHTFHGIRVPGQCSPGWEMARSFLMGLEGILLSPTGRQGLFEVEKKNKQALCFPFMSCTMAFR